MNMQKKIDSLFPYLTLIAASGLFFYYFLTGNIFDPQTNFNDSNYYYLFSAVAVHDALGTPHFTHPGLAFMNFISLFYSAVMPTWTQAHPTDTMIDLLQLGRWVGVLQVVAFSLLSYLITLKLTQNKILSCLLGFFIFSQTGVFENTAMVRSELFSALLVLFSIYLYLRYQNYTHLITGIALSGAFGFLYQLSLSAKILTLLYGPLALIALWKMSSKKIQLTRKQFVMTAASILAPLFLMSWDWISHLDVMALADIIPDSHLSQVEQFTRTIHLMGAGAGLFLVLLTGLLCIHFSDPLDKLNRARQFFILSLASLAGFIASLYTALFSLADDKLAWARRLVYTSWGQTLFDTFIRRRYDNNPASLHWNFFLNHDFVFFISHATFFLGLIVLGLFFGDRKKRLQIVATVLFIWLISCVTATRSDYFVFYYFVYPLVLLVGLSGICMQVALPQIKESPFSKIIYATLSLLFVFDIYQATLYRSEIFSKHREHSSEFLVLQAWGGDVLFEKMIRPTICPALPDIQACAIQAGTQLQNSIDKRSDQNQFSF